MGTLRVETRGLTVVEARRLAELGPNEIRREAATSPWAARNLAFSTIVVCEVFRAFAARSSTKIFWEVGALSNLKLVGVVLVSFLIQLAMHHTPLTQRLFQLGSLSAADCALSVGAGLLPVTLLELSKLVRRAFRGGLIGVESARSA